MEEQDDDERRNFVSCAKIDRGGSGASLTPQSSYPLLPQPTPNPTSKAELDKGVRG